jgi:hypothetical protein
MAKSAIRANTRPGREFHPAAPADGYGAAAGATLSRRISGWFPDARSPN